MSNPLDELDALGLAALVRSGEVTAHELLTLTMKRVEERNPAINAVVQSFEEKARAQIDAGLGAGVGAFLLADVDTAAEVDQQLPAVRALEALRVEVLPGAFEPRYGHD